VEDQLKVEAEAAWTFAMDYLQQWGVERLPLYRGGKRVEAPPLPSRIEYALRRIGGLRGMNQITEESRPFMFKDFFEAFKQAPIGRAPSTWAPRKIRSKAVAGRNKTNHD
jgi:hypothetical protein